MGIIIAHKSIPSQEENESRPCLPVWKGMCAESFISNVLIFSAKVSSKVEMISSVRAYSWLCSVFIDLPLCFTFNAFDDPRLTTGGLIF